MSCTTTSRHLVTVALCAALGLPAVASPAAAATAPAPPLGAYFVERQGPSLRLHRAWLAAPRAATSAERAETAANVVMGEAGLRGRVNLWGERCVTDVVVHRDHAEVVLEGPRRTVDLASARIGVSSVVWTVTAALGRDMPVRFRSADGQVLGGLPTTRDYTRAESRDSLSPVWIDSMSQASSLLGGRVTAGGTVVSHEGTVHYRLTRGTTVVRAGYLTAGIGAPARGTWRLVLGNLPRGSYRLEVWVPDPAGRRTDLGRATRAFTVR